MKLTAAQRSALAHVHEMVEHERGHNQRWPLDRVVPGAYVGTKSLPKRTAEVLVRLGLVVEVERRPGWRLEGKADLTEAGRAALEKGGDR